MISDILEKIFSFHIKKYPHHPKKKGDGAKKTRNQLTTKEDIDDLHLMKNKTNKDKQTFSCKAIQSCGNFLSNWTLQFELHIHASFERPLHMTHPLLKSSHVGPQIINGLPFLNGYIVLSISHSEKYD